MLIEAIEINNFRSIQSETIDINELTVFLGRNGSGKSSILNALGAFYNTAAVFTSEDFFDRDITQAITIRVTYGELSEPERKEFATYLDDGKLVVTKRVDVQGGRPTAQYFGTSMQIPAFAKARNQTTFRDKQAVLRGLSESGDFPGLAATAQSNAALERILAEYEEAHPELLQPVPRQEQFFGPPNIGGGKLDKYTRYVLIPAVKETSDELLSGSSASLNQLLSLIVLRRISRRSDVKEFKERFSEQARMVFGADNLPELAELGRSISKTLSTWSPGAMLNLTWADAEIPEVPPPPATVTLVEDGFEGTVDKKGQGLQRAVILTLLQHLALTEPEASGDDDDTSQDERPYVVQGPGEGPDLILAIEEPELYLHPQRARYVADLLRRLTLGEGGLGARNQIICTTHSPFFADLTYFDDIRVTRKVIEGVATPTTSVHSFSLEQAVDKLAEVSGKKRSDFTRESFVLHSESVMTTLVNEGLFADAVVVVEGLGDASALWEMQRIMELEWPRLGIATVPAMGKNNLDRPTIIFRGFGIPTYLLFDGDDGDQRAVPKNRCYLRLVGAPEADFPPTQANDSWACFGKNIEMYVKQEIGVEVYEQLHGEISEAIGEDRSGHLFKTPSGSRAFIRRLYADGMHLPILEDIAQRVTALLSSGL